MQVKIEQTLISDISEILDSEFGQSIDKNLISIQKTRDEFEGDFTLVVFPFLKISKKSPEQTAEIIGQALIKRCKNISSYNVIKGFLNITLKNEYWVDFLIENMNSYRYGYRDEIKSDAPIVVEFSSPNTNKPLHLGHVRNNLLGYSVAKILEASGKKVFKVNLVNDRGIHICKSMLAYQTFGNGETPESSGKKGDKLVGDYYVLFETELKKQVNSIMNEKGISEEEARKVAPLMIDAQNMLLKWENKDAETIDIWQKMNGWVYEGFDITYERMGVSFDKIYKESETYLLGKELIKEGLEKGVFFKKEDGSVWVDLTQEGLDEKLLLRSDGTSVYMTQDIGTAQLRYDDFEPEKMIYVVGNEQNYHFSVLQKVLKKLNKTYADSLYHLSYGMVELPQGKMKSREGTVVDADELMSEMTSTAKNITESLGKIDGFSDEEKTSLFDTIGLGALKYFILKVDPKKNMMFNPEESIDFNGNTGPFIQYTHARIFSILKTFGTDNLEKISLDIIPDKLNKKELKLIKSLYDFPQVVMDAANELSPAMIANYTYDLCKDFNQFYHEHSILNEPDKSISNFRIKLSQLTANTIRNSMLLLGINTPERM
ncbi:MAG: arginine--tRNA ligase [Bacteroidetes bacterium]|nr:arginine--tRNA ligase [Bacteroidota bacterium]